MPRPSGSGSYDYRGDRDEPIELAGGGGRPGDRASPAQKACSRPGRPPQAPPPLARRLRAHGIEAHVIHPTSVAVSREHRRAKTDRLDTALLKRVFLGWLRGEPGHCTMAAIPTLEEEDARRPNRERESLVGERTRVVNRMKATLARLGIRGFKPTLRGASERLEALRTPEGAALPPNTQAELRRDMARLGFIVGQIKEIEDVRQKGLATQPDQGPPAMVRLLARVN